MNSLIEMGQRAKDAEVILAQSSTKQKDQVLLRSAEALENAIDNILLANQKDVEGAKAADVKAAFIDRLTLTKERILSMADGLRQVAALRDPIGEVLSMQTMANGLIIGQKRVPMGVIGIIFEARPNVTADAFGLCLKAGSAAILRGGKEAIHSNTAIVALFRQALLDEGMPVDCVQILEDTSRETAADMMRLKGYLDVLIPRGGAGLIRSVVENSTVPVIETGTGNCHVFVDESADLQMAADIVINAKTQRPGVCNACESLLVHANIAEKFLPMMGKALQEKKVEIRGDETCMRLIPETISATTEDYATEFSDYIISAKVVENLDEALLHIRRFSTGHSEVIVTENYSNAQRFLNEVDAAAVYVNASSRFTDGCEFGFGAEIGISTQKLHARGPMGLRELTSTKYIIYGQGQIRE